jgi:2-polyprenyl-6-methoxyphenol hydroxylase-like FAD-dependent oxidoreductase
MGLVPQILRSGYPITEVRQVDRAGRRVGGFAANVFTRMAAGRFTSVPRSELSAALYGALGGHVETIFDDGVTAIEDLGGEVRVQFERAPARAFDLVVGADGLHSEVRRLVFGEESRWERYLGIKVAAFVVPGYRPRDELVYLMHTEVGHQVSRFSMRDDRTMFLFIFAEASPDLPRDVHGQRALLRETFSASGWECPQILEALEHADDLYMDRVSQIHMERWSRGRVALAGDAAFCVSLLGGQGSALAMVAAYVLAGELKRARGDHVAAFAQYQARLGPFLAMKQGAALRFAPFFAPRSRIGIFLRNQVMKLMAVPFIADRAVGREFRDAIELPD